MKNLKILFYSEMEATTYANRFTKDMTIDDLLKGIEEKKYPIIDHSAYSPDFDTEVKGKVYLVEGMKVQSVVLEDDSIAYLNAEEGTHKVYSEKYNPKWVWLLDKICQINEAKEKIKKLEEEIERKRLKAK